MWPEGHTGVGQAAWRWLVWELPRRSGHGGGGDKVEGLGAIVWMTVGSGGSGFTI